MPNPILKYFLLLAGFLSFILGVIGAFLPVLPTTPFMLLSALCFSKSSEKLHIWLTSLPYFGSAIIDWERNKVIRPRAKFAALGTIWLSIGLTVIFAKLHLGLKIMLILIAFSTSFFIWTRKSYAENEN